MVTGRACYDTFLLLRLGKLRDFIISTPQLERSCSLKILCLEINFLIWEHARSTYEICCPAGLFESE